MGRRLTQMNANRFFYPRLSAFIRGQMGGGQIFQPKNDPLPFDFRFLKVDEKTDPPARGSQIVETLSSVFVRDAIRTFEFDKQDIFNKDVGEIFSDAVAFVGYRKRRLRNGMQSTKTKLLEQGSLVNLFQKPSSERVGYFKDRTNHLLRQRIQQFAFINVHQRPKSMCISKPICLKPNVRRRLTQMNANRFFYPRLSAFIRGY